MQFKDLGFILLVLIMLPGYPALASSDHFNLERLNQQEVFVSVDGNFSLAFPNQEYQNPVDVYLFELDSSFLNHQLTPLSPVYHYTLVSSELDEEIELTLTLAYQGDNSHPKTVYYFDKQTNIWRMASLRAFENNLTFKIKGKSNKLVIAGTDHRVAEPAAKADFEDGAYNFNLDPTKSDLDVQKVCQPYLSSYFKTQGRENETEVKKLQTFLHDYEGFTDLPSTGYYGNQTYNAVKSFQEKYAKDILAPWNLSRGTGWVLGATLDKINELYCDYNPKQISYEFSIPYQLSSKVARSAYILAEDGSWEKLESFDDYRNKKVTGITSSKTAQVIIKEDISAEVGEASWYAWQSHEGFYAASRDYPKGTKLKVTNQSAGSSRGKSIIVEIDDYGPELWTGRIIDLRKEAFDALASLSQGVISVKIELVK